MKVTKISFGILALLAVVAVVGAACGGQPTAPAGNQPPIISSLVAQSQQLYPSANTEIVCSAQDADDDQLSFTWTATGGSFSGTTGPIVVWKAPPNYGTYMITVTVDDDKGNTTQRSLEITVGANQAPQISSLSANPSGVLYGGSTRVTCIANDPDGDTVRYSWEASGGSISGVGNEVTWVAPSKGGSYNITVIVSDNKGGETTGNVPVTVATTSNTITIPPVAQETGTVDSDGDKDTSRTIAGDNEKNVGYRAFWSYDVFSLAGKNIENATLKLTTKYVVGDPFSSVTGLGGLRFWKVTYGDKLPNFNFTGSNLINAPLQAKAPTAIDVTQEITNVTAGAINRFQVEALFEKKISNGNNIAEYIEWSDAVLEVTFSER